MTCCDVTSGLPQHVGVHLSLVFPCSIMLDADACTCAHNNEDPVHCFIQGIIVDSAVDFCESLMSPYSDNFLWSGSTAYLPTAVTMPSQPYSSHAQSYGVPPSSPLSSSSSESQIKKTLFSDLPTATTPKGHGKHGVEEFRCHFSQQPHGLRVVLA